MSSTPEPRFACDAMFGGLARWLRAAGYDAWWRADVDDWELIRLAQREGRTLLTSDTGIFRVGIVRDGEVPGLLIPHGLGKQAQLRYVLDRLRLTLREPRCMACGGDLVEVSREAARPRVPPRSFDRHEHFYECGRCGRLFWLGTHWQHIAEVLGRVSHPENSTAPSQPLRHSGPPTGDGPR